MFQVGKYSFFESQRHPVISGEASASEDFYGDLDFSRDSASSYMAMNQIFGGTKPKRSSVSDLDETIGKKFDETVLSRAILQLKYHHEQRGSRPLFEIRLNQLLSDGDDLNPRMAKEFLLGLLATGRFDALSDENKKKSIKLSEISAVRAEFASEKASVFNPKPAGFDVGFRPR